MLLSPFTTYLIARKTVIGDDKIISSKTDTGKSDDRLPTASLTNTETLLLIISAAFCDLIASSIENKEKKKINIKKRRADFPTLIISDLRF